MRLFAMVLSSLNVLFEEAFYKFYPKYIKKYINVVDGIGFYWISIDERNRHSLDI